MLHTKCGDTVQKLLIYQVEKLPVQKTRSQLHVLKVYITEESSLDGLPEPVSSSYGQTHAGSPPQHPTGDCGPGTAGCLCRDPKKEG